MDTILPEPLHHRVWHKTIIWDGLIINQLKLNRESWAFVGNKIRTEAVQA